MIDAKNMWQWIPVAEQLPEKRVRVVALQKDGLCNVEWRMSDGKWTTYAKITHWMPLPPLPKEEVQG